MISVNRAQPKHVLYDHGYGYGGGCSSAAWGNFGGGRGGDRDRFGECFDIGRSDCFKCGRPGHWDRECPSSGGGSGGRGARFPLRSKFGGGSRDGDRFGGDCYMDDRYDGGRYGDQGRFESRDRGYGARDRYAGDRYSAGGDRFGGDCYGPSDRYPQNGYGKYRGYDRELGPRGSSDRYGGGPPNHPPMKGVAAAIGQGLMIARAREGAHHPMSAIDDSGWYWTVRIVNLYVGYMLSVFWCLPFCLAVLPVVNLLLSS